VKILGLDTATRATATALCEIRDGGLAGPAAERRDDPPPGARPGHAAKLLPLAFELLADTGTTWEQLGRIAVGVGPGTFTGLRIGIATARGLAEARGIPLVGISTLQSLALTAVPEAVDRDLELIAAVIDARRGELFAAAWRRETVAVAGAAPVIAERAYPPDELAAALDGAGTGSLAIGDGAIPFRKLLERCGARIPPDGSRFHRVSAIGHCRLGAAIDERAAEDVLPRYLRLPDAELSRRSARP
jgi:tRNA threonylcarbamoyladenosine biosynthesis protein TsaB